MVLVCVLLNCLRLLLTTVVRDWATGLCITGLCLSQLLKKVVGWPLLQVIAGTIGTGAVRIAEAFALKHRRRLEGWRRPIGKHHNI